MLTIAEVHDLPEPDAEARNLAMIAHLLALLTGIIGPLILFLVKREESPFVAFHALQALLLELVLSALMFVIVLVGVFLIFPLCFAPVVVVFAIVINILGLLAAQRGEWACYPIFGDYALESTRRQYAS